MQSSGILKRSCLVVLRIISVSLYYYTGWAASALALCYLCQ